MSIILFAKQEKKNGLRRRISYSTNKQKEGLQTKQRFQMPVHAPHAKNRATVNHDTSRTIQCGSCAIPTILVNVMEKAPPLWSLPIGSLSSLLWYVVCFKRRLI